MSARDISKALDGKPNGLGFLCRCPVPSHGKGKGDRSPSLSVTDGDDGKLLVCCFGCDPRDVLAELRLRRLAGSETVPRQSATPAPTKPPPEPEPDERALELWQSAIPASGTPAEQYLRARGITLPIPPTLRFIPNVDYMPRVGFPAMVAAVQRPDRAVIAIQVTFLDPRGDRKAPVATPRKTIGKLGSGVVRLGPAGSELGLAEGVETALSAMQLSGVPVWACLGAKRMSGVSIPETVHFLEIFPDNDASGQSAMTETMERNRANCAVRAQIPPNQFNDWNDYLALQMRAPAAWELA